MTLVAGPPMEVQVRENCTGELDTRANMILSVIGCSVPEGERTDTL